VHPFRAALLALAVACGPSTPAAKPVVTGTTGPALAKIERDAQPIVDAWASAVGGREAIAALGPVHGKGMYEKGGMRGTIDVWFTPRGERREEIVLGDLREVRIFDGTRGWLIDRNHEVRELGGFELDDELALAFRESFAPLVVDRRAGMITRDGENLVLAPQAGGRTEMVAFDRGSHLPLSTMRRHGEKMRQTTFSDWNSVGGVKLPWTIREDTGNPNETVVIHFKNLDRGAPLPTAFSQPPDRVPDMGMSNNPTTIPIEVAFGGLIFVKGSINDQPMSFVFDTGAEATVLSASRVAKLNLQPFGKFATGAGGGDVVLAYVPHVTTRVGDATVSDQIVAAINLDDIERMLQRPVDGILGYDFISRFVIELDYAHSSMRLFDRATYQHTGAGKPIAITLEDSTPYFDAAVSVPQKGDLVGHFVLDTGCLCEVTLFSPFVDQNKLLTAFPKAKQAGLAAGAGGKLNQLSTTIPAVRLGEQIVKDPNAQLSRDHTGGTANPETAGLIGSVLLKKFVLVLDYKRKQIFLDPSK